VRKQRPIIAVFTCNTELSKVARETVVETSTQVDGDAFAECVRSFSKIFADSVCIPLPAFCLAAFSDEYEYDDDEYFA